MVLSSTSVRKLTLTLNSVNYFLPSFSLPSFIVSDILLSAPSELLLLSQGLHLVSVPTLNIFGQNQDKDSRAYSPKLYLNYKLSNSQGCPASLVRDCLTGLQNKQLLYLLLPPFPPISTVQNKQCNINRY